MLSEKPGLFESWKDAISFALSAAPVIFAVCLSTAIVVVGIILIVGLLWR